ncbi:hypothetical protein [Luteimicrobium sp. DT211]|uniref:hypothetical protein n=1 Tax=Luteimicrobium sp. DT211 TaxID=3393412 RepID=UPI003CF5BA66
MGLFGRRRAADPSSWDELWEALAPLGGRLTPEAVARWEDVVATSPPAFLEAASEQLGYAYRLLGTEAHAREIEHGAFAGTGEPFAAGRFARVVDAVVAAGPEAVARVAADPGAIRSYATAVPLLDPVLAYRGAGPVTLAVELGRARERSSFERGAELRAPRAARRAVLSPTDLDKDAMKAWPSLAGRKPERAWAGIADPEEPWLDVDASNLDDTPGVWADPEAFAEGRKILDAPGSWFTAGAAAAERLFVALGPDGLGVEARASSVGLVSLELQRPGDGAEPRTEAEQSVEVLTVPVTVDAGDEAVSGAEARADVLVRACARRLLELPLVATPQNLETLARLAGG